MKNVLSIKALLVLFVFGFFLSCKHKPEDKSIVRSTKYKESIIESYQKLGLLRTMNNIPGFSIAISIDNEVVWADGIGLSNYELKTPVSPSHKFRIGQVTELITALTVAKLYEEGKLDLDKPVAQYLPEMKPKSFDFTIRQLGAHASGIRNEVDPEAFGSMNSLDSTIASFIDEDLIFEPGAYYLNSNLNFDLIGYLLEKSSNKRFAKIVEETLLDTLHLENTIYEMPMRITDNKASNYDYDFMAQPIVAKHVDFRGKQASIGYLSSALDLVKLGNTLLYPGFLKQETIDFLTTPIKLKGEVPSLYSFGIFVSRDKEDHLFYGQQGSVNGGSAAILIYPEDKMVIAITGNIKSNSWEYPIFDVAKIFRYQLHPEEKPKTETQEEK